jgi:ribosomal RNA-processing protein 17
LREERKQELEEHVEAVNALLKEHKIPGLDSDSEESDDEGWNGIADEPAVEPIDHEAEYIDEDKYTTVTVEEVDVSKDGLHRPADEEAEEKLRAEKAAKAAKAKEEEEKNNQGKKVWPKKRKQKFRYETKIERRLTRGKQHASNKAAAAERRGRT